MVYVDDGIFLGNDDLKLQAAIQEIQELRLNIEDQGHPADYVGVNIKKLQDGLWAQGALTVLPQPQLQGASETVIAARFDGLVAGCLT